ncbi:MAG: sec-independent protein translocase protein TatA [Alphaproteobacteria bacterium]|jgi:sec-independent protein translocase protein TatA
MNFGFWQIVIIALLGVLLFGRGRISDLMGDVAKGIKSFKKGLSEDEEEDAKPKTQENPKLQPQEPMLDMTPPPLKKQAEEKDI